MKNASGLACLAFTVLLVIPPAAATTGPNADAPLLGSRVPRGVGRTVVVSPQSPAPKRADGDISDWRGRPTRFAGTSIYSRGELIYQDHLFDAYGAASDQNVTAFQAADAAEGAESRLGRVRGLYQFFFDLSAGAAPLQHAADLLELRVAADRERLHLLARMNLMHDTDRPALLVLADTTSGRHERRIPFNSGLTTTRADVALLLGPGRVAAADLSSGKVKELEEASVATNPHGYTNAIEAAVPIDSVGSRSRRRVRLAVATGTLAKDGDLAPLDGSGAAVRLANVAFRREPLTSSFESRQALALHRETIDPFFAAVDLKRLRSGYSERYLPGAGYHVRSFTAPVFVSDESPGRGANREYGVYLPAGSGSSEALPLTTFLHGSSGNTGSTNHAYIAALPGLTRDFGDLLGGIVVFPKDRQVPTKRAGGYTDGSQVSSGLWVSESIVELRAIWKDAIATFGVDRDRQYLTGYSMGGIGTYLIPGLMPDRFAAVHVTAGMIFDDKDYPSVNFPGQVLNPWPQFNALKITENFLHVPTSIFAGATDEATPWLENVEPVLRYSELGYRHRFYTFPGDHYYKGLMDEWAEPARYLAASRRRRNPARVVLVRDMELERSVEVGNYKAELANPKVEFSFDSSFWVSGLTPSDLKRGRAVVDARSFAISAPGHREVLEAGGPSAPGQTGPYVMEGLAWESTGKLLGKTGNGFRASLTGAKAVRLDLDRMAIDVRRSATGRIRTDHALLLHLNGGWSARPRVVVNGSEANASFAGGILEIRLRTGSSTVKIFPTAGATG